LLRGPLLSGMRCDVEVHLGQSRYIALDRGGR
jgi:hypothetical protein